MGIKRILYLIISSVVLLLSSYACNREVAIKGKQAREYFNNQEYNKVIEILETIKPSSRTSYINLLLGKSYGTILEFDKADQIFKTIFKKDHSFKDSLITAYLSLASRFEGRGREDLAVKAYKSLLDMESKYNIGNGFYTLGHYYYRRNDLVKARGFLEKGVKHITNPAILKEAKIELMDLCESLGMFREAIEISYGDSSGDILYRRGEISYKFAKELFTQQKLDSALVFCKDILEINTPKTLIDDTYFLMGEIYYAAGDYKNALRSYRKVVRLDMYRNTEIASKARRKIQILTQLKKGG